MSALAILGANAACGTAGTVTFLCFQLPWGPSSAAKILTAFLFWTFTLIAFGFHRFAPISLLKLQRVGEDAICGDDCLRYYIVLRVMTMIAIYHAALAAILYGVTSTRQGRSIFQTAMWPVKGLMLLMGVGGAFLIPQVFIDYIYWLGLACSGVFVLMQVVLLVDMACTWAETLVTRYEETEGPIYKWTLVFLTGALYTAVIAGGVALFVVYPLATDRLLVGVAVVLAMLMTGLSLSERVQEAHPGAGIFPAAVLSLYSLYMLTSAFLSRPSNRRLHPNGLASLVAYFGYIFAFLSIGYSAYTTGRKSQRLTGKTQSSSSASLPKEGDEVESEYNYSLFHAIFMCAAFYVGIVMTRWKQAVVVSGAIQLHHTTNAFWVKLVTGWLQAGLYLWTLFAPIVFPDRDFSV